jgi:hypothetical protein
MVREKIEEDEIKFDKSTSLTDSDTLLKRARAKHFTLAVVVALANLKSPLEKSYWNTWHCCHNLEHYDGKITGKYCKNRWCLVCNRIKTATSIKKYSDIIASWGEDSYFVTLTIVSPSGNALESTIDSMAANFIKIKDVINKRRHLKFIGLRKIECTYNPVADTYHPHYHCVIKGKEQADLLVNEWLKRYPTSIRSYSPSIRIYNSSEMELFKYFTKIVTNKKSGLAQQPEEFRRKIYVNALDIIFSAMRNKRVYQSFGFTAKNVNERDEEVIEIAEKLPIGTYTWVAAAHDWIDLATGDCLTGYEPSEGMEKLVKSIETPQKKALYRDFDG